MIAPLTFMKKHDMRATWTGFMIQNEFCMFADVYVQIVGIIQLCEQVAHETPPEQDVPDSLNPRCAPQWARSENTNHLPLRPGKANSKEARSKVNGTEISEAKKARNVLYGRPGFFRRTPTPAKDPHLILASLIDPSSPGPHLRPLLMPESAHRSMCSIGVRRRSSRPRPACACRPPCWWAW